MPIPIHAGGSFAPPFDSATLIRYEPIIATCTNDKWREAMRRLHIMAVEFYKTPPSTNGGTPHASGRGSVVPLEEAEVKRIWDHVPWDYEVAAIGEVFEQIPVSDPARNVAFHLLWLAGELTLDREPITSNKI